MTGAFQLVLFIVWDRYFFGFGQYCLIIFALLQNIAQMYKQMECGMEILEHLLNVQEGHIQERRGMPIKNKINLAFLIKQRV